ncbi:hypothetical protein Taro_000938, partial [Colocasia esculenta]|nr:hypothetical protein [Colocasia esculenta]
MTNKCYTRRAIILVLVVLWPSCYSCYTRYLCYFWKLYSISCYCAISCYILTLLYLLSLDILPLNALTILSLLEPEIYVLLGIIAHPTLFDVVRPRMTHTLTRKGMTKSEARSTLESLCYLRVVVRPRMTHTLTTKGMTKSEARSTLESL